MNGSGFIEFLDEVFMIFLYFEKDFSAFATGY
jgi:hypothetical protein